MALSFGQHKSNGLILSSKLTFEPQMREILRVFLRRCLQEEDRGKVGVTLTFDWLAIKSPISVLRRTFQILNVVCQVLKTHSSLMTCLTEDGVTGYEGTCEIGGLEKKESG